MVSPDKYQQKVIDSNKKDIVILAGAGSGKTFTLLEKIHNLVSYKGVNPESILVLTFTRMAAMGMRERYILENKAQYQNTPDFNTFHAFCYRVISENRSVMNKLGYVIVPSIAEEEESEEIRKEAKKISGCKLSFKKMEHPEELSIKDRIDYDNYRNVLTRLYRKKNKIGYDDLIKSVCGLFVEDDDSVKHLKEKYKYVFVDEFQDTDQEQFRFVMSMERSNRLLCGDALQNIYQFRGCNNEPLKLLSNNPCWSTYELPINYRSTEQICEYSNEMSKDFISKDWRIVLISKTGPGKPVREFDLVNTSGYFNHMFNDDYMDSVISELRSFSEGNTAILCRTNMEVLSICEGLNESQIQYQTLQKTEYDVNIIQSIIEDDDNLSYFIQDDEDNKNNKKFIRDVNFVKEILSKNLTFNEKMFMLENVFNVTLDKSKNFQSNNELLSHIMNRIQNNVCTYVGTIHSVKGLEFDNVIVVNVGSKRFFNLDKEENQNLIYVACTRAKKNLSIFKSSE